MTTEKEVMCMSKNEKKTEQTSAKVAALAAKVLAGYRPTQGEAKQLAGSVLTQAPDKKQK
jgi:hypothetical protein